jgi:bifunctional DNA-binding transcriptional regulator/antitoxin component of YhaV-PrlF toxin-antitoxin module
MEHCEGAPTTIVSTKDQVIPPKAVRDLRKWPAGTRLTVETTADGVLLRAAPHFAPTAIETFFCALAYDGPPKSIEEMDAAIARKAERRARD